MATFWEKLNEILNIDKDEELNYIGQKAKEYRDLFDLDNKGDGWNDETDGFRHAWGSAYLAMKYNDAISKAGTWDHENFGDIFQSQESDERRMDEWNNAIGREIAKELKSQYKDIDENINWSTIEDVIALKAKEKLQNGEALKDTTDESFESANKIHKLRVEKSSNPLKNILSSQKKKLKAFKDRLSAGKGGNVHVDEYTRGNGIRVKSYNRSRPKK